MNRPNTIYQKALGTGLNMARRAASRSASCLHRIMLVMGLLGLSVGALAQEATVEQPESKGVSFWSNWYLQAGFDMSLQNPYGYDFFGSVIPKGMSFGVDAAIGHWFTPGIGVRGRVNWENGIGLFRNNRAVWLAPFHKPGVNMDRGGYIGLTADVQIDIQNTIRGYDPRRKWNFQIYPRGGFAYNFGVSKGTPLIGLGIGNTYKINDRWLVYLDFAYQAVSSGFVGVDKATGVGSNSNGYFDLTLGVQFNLSKKTEFEEPEAWRAMNAAQSGRSIWHNWYLQMGLDMSLMFPYGYNVSKVMSKGRTFGLDLGVGKWFSPEIGARARVKWENGFPLFKNSSLEWMGPFGKPNTNMDHGGYLAAYGEVQFSLTSIVRGYDPERRWNLFVFPRAGLISNLATKSLSPMVGAGVGCTYRLNKKWSLYGDVAYQATTSEFFGIESATGMKVPTGHNCLADVHLGVQLDL